MADPALVTSVLYYLGITLGLVLLVKYLLGSKSTTNIPPFPAQPYAILGHLPYLKKGMRNQMKEWGRKAGDIYSIKFGPRLMVVLNSYAAVHEAFVKQADAFSDRTPQSFIHSVSSQTGLLSKAGVYVCFTILFGV
ncbi:cytochrome p450 ii f2-like protein ii [Plakobranchus ocellatus]|uniref:Cytochrome p450 ii f2-like protein ii n=1 Tax=Plakobranchus ocellatus TaxID=259542 RepID=A0AAV4CTQ9_9GAST|nr:cytochrome p450 ii f2-like protein ii [Plakobranchus ocellatus]